MKYVIAKPLPFMSEPPPDDRVSTTLHRQGTERLQAMIEWFKRLDQSDPLSLWDDRPAVLRMDFARLHFDQSPADIDSDGREHGA